VRRIASGVTVATRDWTHPTAELIGALAPR
jgi:hypothetical protein